MPSKIPEPPDDALALAHAELARRQRQQQMDLRAVYDWYAPSCPCNLPPGKCRIHPRARPEQRPPGTPHSPWPPDYPWSVFLMQAGRGGGKTYAASQYIRWLVERGIWREFLIIGDTIRNVIDYQVYGESGLETITPPWFPAKFWPSYSMVVWPNGAKGHLATAEKPKSLRGGNMDGAWADEVGKWDNQQMMWDQMEWVLRNKNVVPPRVIVSTTPTPTDVIIDLNKKADLEAEHPHSTGVLRSNWDMRRNADNLADEYVQKQTEKYDGTLEGEQELAGKLVLKKEGALWSPEDFSRPGFLLDAIPSDLEYVGIGVDPGAGGENKKKASEHGIVVAGRMPPLIRRILPRGVILDDYSLTGKPDEWGAAVIRAFWEWMASEIIVEKNQGGEMAEHVLRTVPAIGMYPSGKDVPIKMIFASVGKIVRAEPVQLLYASGRMHHLKGRLAQLELQMTQYIPGKVGQKLDRVDAAVHVLNRAILERERYAAAGPILVGAGRDPYQYVGGRPMDDSEVILGGFGS